MHRQVLLAVGLLLLSGCGGASRPIYQFGLSEAPLRYRITQRASMSVETPVGEQGSTDSTHATVAIEIGEPIAGGHRVSATFEVLELWEGGDFGIRHATGGDLIGAPFTGTLSPSGRIAVATAPAVPAEITAMADPSEIIADLLPPLPPGGGATTGSWPHNTSATLQVVMSIETRYQGTARFAGDTTWNGVAARIIVSEGTVETTARGTPRGAPGEIEMVQTGTSRTIYVWDARRGVMLASRSTIEAEGEVELLEMQMSLRVVYKGDREIQLQ